MICMVCSLALNSYTENLTSVIMFFNVHNVPKSYVPEYPLSKKTEKKGSKSGSSSKIRTVTKSPPSPIEGTCSNPHPQPTNLFQTY